MDPFMGGGSDWNSILQLLKSEDEMDIYSGAMTLRDSLQYAQENQMHGFMTEQFMDILVKIVNRDLMSELGLEVKFFAIQALTTIMDIFPSLVNNLVNAGLVKGMTSVMQQSVGFTELSEACIKCLEKVVQENPPAVLKSGAIAVVLDQMPFFVQSTQKKIFKIILKIARHSSNESDFDQHLMPVLPFILMNLSEDTLVNDLNKFEDASKIVFEMQESFVLFLSPTHDFKKVGLQYDKLSKEGLFDIIIDHVRTHCKNFANKYALQAQKFGNNQAKNDPLLRDLIQDKLESGPNQIVSNISDSQISHQIIQNYLKILENACRYSINVSNKLFGQSSLLHDLGCFLPSDQFSASGSKHQLATDNFPFINEAVNLLSALLSDKAEQAEADEGKKQEQENDEDGDSVMKGEGGGGSGQQIEEKDKVEVLAEVNREGKGEDGGEKDKEAAIASLPPHLKRRVLQQEFQAKKREYQIKEENKSRIGVLAEILLPRVFHVYEIMINPQFRIKTLQLIDKIIALFDNELLQNFIKPQQFANFIYQIIRSKHIFSIEVCLRMTKKIIDCSPFTFSVPFIREGVSTMIEQLSEEQKLKAFLGIKSDVDINQGQFDIEIHSLKEAISYQRINHPEDHHTRDFYERRLLELVDRQRHMQQLQAQEKAEVSKINTMNQKLAQKGSKALKPNPFSSVSVMPEKQNILPKIIAVCKLLMTDYFSNQEFLSTLEKHSEKNKEQLSTFKQLQEIAQLMQTESTKPLVCLKNSENFQELIRKFCVLLTKQGSSALTSHEFRDSGMLNSIELLLTKTPSQVKYLIEKKRIDKESNGVLKHSDELYLMEIQQKSQGQISSQDGISVMNRLKLFVHLLLQKQNGQSPIDGLIKLNHKSPGPQIDYSSYGSGFGGMGGPPGFYRDNYNQGDYDQCISALKQLQKRVTVNLIYDPQKNFKDPNAAQLSSALKDKNPSSSNPFTNTNSFIRQIFEQEKQSKEVKMEAKDPEKEKEADKLSDQENSHMEDLSEVKQNISEDVKDGDAKKEQTKLEEIVDKDEKQGGDSGADGQSKEAKIDQIIDKKDDQIQSSGGGTELKEDGLELKKVHTQLAPQSIRSLAASPSKQQVILEIEKQNMNSSKVYMKRHFLYNEIQQIPVTVEQSSCLQILEDFLRNKIRSIEEVKLLKRDYGYGGGGGMHQYKDPWSRGGPDFNSASPFDQALGGSRYQSITQKILRKNLGSEARKMLDQANNRLAKILNTGSGIKIAQRKPKSKKQKRRKQSKDDNKDKTEEMAVASDAKNEEVEKQPAADGDGKDKKEEDVAIKEEDAKPSEDKKEGEVKATDGDKILVALSPDAPSKPATYPTHGDKKPEDQEMTDKKDDGDDVQGAPDSDKKKEGAVDLFGGKEDKSERSGSKSSGSDSHLDDDDDCSNYDDEEGHEGLDDVYDSEEMMEEHEEVEEDRRRGSEEGNHAEQVAIADEEEKHRQLDDYIHDLPEQIINSKIPDDQQHMLVKILTKQHTFMMGYLEMNIQEGGGGPSEEEMIKFEQKLEDFQDTMDAVKARFLSLKDMQAMKKKQEKKQGVKEEAAEMKKKSEGGNDTSRDDIFNKNQQTILEILNQAKNSAEKDKDSDQEMALEDAKVVADSEDKVENPKPAEKSKEEADKADKPADFKIETEMSHPQVKLDIKNNNAEMMKPAEVSDSEHIEDSEVPKQGDKDDTNKDKVEDVSKIKSEILDVMMPTLKKEDRTESEIVLEKKKKEQELLVQRALKKDEQNLERMKASIKEREHGKNVLSAEAAMGEQSLDIINQDLEKLIKEEGEDIEFEFYYEHKQITLNQTIFEITKNADTSKRYSEKAHIHAEQLRILKEKEELLKSRAREIAAIKDKEKEKENEMKIAQLKNDYNMIKEIFNQIQKQYDMESKGSGDFSFFGGGGHGGPPPGFLSSFGHVHRIYFRIKDKNEEVNSSRQGSRFDSLSDAVLSDFKRTRTKSEAVQDLSGASIKTFIEQLLFKEFNVFDKQEERPATDDKKAQQDKPEDLNKGIDQKKLNEMKDKLIIDEKFPTITADADEKGSVRDKKKEQEKEERNILESSLKILKVINFIYNNKDIISERGMKFVTEGFEPTIAADNDVTMSSSLAPETIDVQLTDLSLSVGFAEMETNLFHNHKLDTYLQKSIKDPINLVQGISAEMQQVFKNCPYLFPFQTKLLYFKLVSFISSIDVHRSIYFLRQYLRQHSGGMNQQLKDHEKDNIKKITRQKLPVNRQKILESAFSIIQRIDKRNFLEVSFEGEEGTGLGPTLEFYDSVAEEFQKWKIDINDKIKDFKMWRSVANGDLFPTPICIKTFDQSKIKQIYEIFRLCGTLIAKAIVDDRQIDMPISPIFWKICLGHQMSIFDYQMLETSEDGSQVNNEKFYMLADFQILFNKSQMIEQDYLQEKIDEETKKKRLDQLKTSRGLKVEDYFMSFTLPEPYSYVELISKGSTMDVALESAQDYVDLVLHYTFHESIKIQVQAFKKGFNSIFPISSLQPFVHASSKEDEIQQIICGQPCRGPEWTNPEELMKHIEPDHGYNKKSEPYQYFIRYITELPPSERPNFLKFLTGSKRLPLGGFKNLQPNLTFVKKAQEIEKGVTERDINLPSCNTCFNYVKCPPYTSYEVLKLKFDMALNYGQGNFSFS